MAVSGTGTSGLQFRAHWVAQPLTANAAAPVPEWEGPIFHKTGNSALIPHTRVKVQIVSGLLRLTLSGPGLPDRVRDCAFRSPFFHEVALEFDAEQGVGLLLDYDTGSHPDRPGALPIETLTIPEVFERAGIRVTRTGQDSIVPTSGGGANAAWSSAEMHDAMQVHFSTLAALPSQQRDRARWALWTFFAGLFEEEDGTVDSSIGGIMFDSIGAAERQGTALFLDSFIKDAPGGDAAPAAWRRRMAFWTAVHEMGHSFNLLHAWQKELGTPWIPQTSGFDLLSFMNYPFLYQTGSQSNSNTIRFFDDFEFRFSDDELLFLRHAPERFVIMGGERFGSNHALQQANVSPDPPLVLEARVNRDPAEFEFLEPVVIELKLTNVTDQPRLVADGVLGQTEGMTVLIENRKGEQVAFEPYAHYCRQARAVVLAAGQSVYESLFLSVGADGWLIVDPGYYEVQVCLHMPGEDIVSNRLTLRVAPPRSRDEEYLAQDYFSDDIGRALTFDGTRFMEAANDTLREVAAKLPESKVAVQAQVALAMPRLRPFKVLRPTDEARTATRYRIRDAGADGVSAAALARVVGKTPAQADKAAGALGHIDYKDYSERCMASMERQGEQEQAQDLCRKMYQTFESRKVLPRVLNEIAQQITAYGGKAEPKPKKPATPRRRRRKGG
jgi:hypothetical protein